MGSDHYEVDLTKRSRTFLEGPRGQLRTYVRTNYSDTSFSELPQIFLEIQIVIARCFFLAFLYSRGREQQRR